jgi:hypothetical protein
LFLVEPHHIEMAPKRGAQQQGGKAAKQPRPQPADPYTDALDAALGFLDMDESLTQAGRSMLRSAAPHGLRAPIADRHKFEEVLAGKLRGILQGVGTQARDAVASAANAKASCSTERSVASDALSAAAEKEVQKKGELDLAEKAMAESHKAFAAAKVAVAAAKEAADGLKAQHEANEKDKTERDALIRDTWQMLKDGAVPAKQWRERNKMVDTIVAALQTYGVEQSLVLSLPVALKTKPDDRQFMALEAIKHADAYLQKSLADLEEKINRHDSEVSDRAKDVASAEAALVAAEEELGERTDAKIAAENSSVEAFEAHREATAAIEVIDCNERKHMAALSEAEASLAEISAALSRFEIIFERGEAGVLPQETAEVTQADDASMAAPIAVEA